MKSQTEYQRGQCCCVAHLAQNYLGGGGVVVCTFFIRYLFLLLNKQNNISGHVKPPLLVDTVLFSEKVSKQGQYCHLPTKI